MSHQDSSTASLFEALRGVLAQVAEPRQVLKTILDAAVGQTGADRGVFVEVTHDGQLSYQVLHRFDRHALSGQAGRYSRSILEKVMNSGRGMRLANALDDPRFMREESIQGLRLVSILCMPIHIRERVAAMVHLENNRPDHFTKAHEDLLGSLLEIAGPVLEALHAGRDLIRERDRLKLSEGRARQELEESREVLSRDWSFGRYVGRSAAVRDLEAVVHRASATSFPVLYC